MDKYTTYVGMDVHARSITARAMVKETEAEAKMMRGQVERAARSERNAPYTDAFCKIKSMATANAFTARAEFGDFARFSSGRKVSCWARMNSATSPVHLFILTTALLGRACRT